MAVAAVVMIVFVALRTRLRLMGVRAMVVMRMAKAIPVAVAVTADAFVGEGLPCHRCSRLMVRRAPTGLRAQIAAVLARGPAKWRGLWAGLGVSSSLAYVSSALER